MSAIELKVIDMNVYRSSFLCHCYSIGEPCVRYLGSHFNRHYYKLCIKYMHLNFNNIEILN